MTIELISITIVPTCVRRERSFRALSSRLGCPCDGGNGTATRAQSATCSDLRIADHPCEWERYLGRGTVRWRGLLPALP
jgi:hypothetical protein